MMHITSQESPLRILLIEDSKGDALLLKNALMKEKPDHFVFEHVTTIENALKALTEHTFDIALLDRTLPDANGFDGLHSIQSIAPELPIVYLTNYQDEKIAMQSIQQGAQDYIYKGDYNAHAVLRSMQYAILRKQFEGVLIARANYDMLTGLANRTLFESRLEMGLARIRRNKGRLALLFIDLNKFKPVNDAHGHLVGDELLKKMAANIKAALRQNDTAARFGGDEFAVLIEGIDDAQQVQIIARKLAHIIGQPININGISLKVSASIGIAMTYGDMSITAERLLKQADSAMYEAKSLAESNIHIHVEKPLRKSI